MNDLPTCLECTDVTLYADDTVIYCEAESSQDLQCKLDLDLRNVISWFTKNKLTLNSTKSKFMLIGSTQRLSAFSSVQLNIYGEVIDKVDNFKYLGMTLNANLSWHNHIYNVQSKVRQKLAILGRIRCHLPIYARKFFYNTMIKPHFDYASIIWGDKHNISLMEPLQVLQNRAAKLILGRDYYSSASTALADLGGHA